MVKPAAINGKVLPCESCGTPISSSGRGGGKRICAACEPAHDRRYHRDYMRQRREAIEHGPRQVALRAVTLPQMAIAARLTAREICWEPPGGILDEMEAMLDRD